MIIIRSNFKKINGSLSLAIGNFDGVHKGHKFIIDQLRTCKQNVGDKIGILSFYPHPVKVINPGAWKNNLIRFRTKYYLLKQEKIDFFINLRFDKNLSKMSATSFIEKYLIELMSVKNVLVGEDFRFGRNREGNINLLNKYHNEGKFNLRYFKKIGTQEPFSSSSAKEYLSLGKMEEINSLLGYFWEVSGKVIRGKAMGRHLGFPTANINYLYQMAPSNGIYACWVKIESENNWRMAAISSGIRPQYKGKEKILEVHILNYTGNLYKKRLRVKFVKKIRDEQVFDSEKALIKQMEEDCKFIKNVLINNKQGIKKI